MSQTLVTTELYWSETGNALATLANLQGLSTGDAKYQIVQLTGVDLTSRKKLNFSGSYWNVYDDSGNNRTVVGLKTTQAPGNLVAYDSNGAISAYSSNIGGYTAYFTQNNGVAVYGENVSTENAAAIFFNEVGPALALSSDGGNVIHVEGYVGKFAEFQYFNGFYYTVINLKTSGVYPVIALSQHDNGYSGNLTIANLSADRTWTLPNTNGNILTDQVSRTETMWIPASRFISRASNGTSTGILETPTNKNMLYSLNFDPTGIEYAQTQIQLPKKWNKGNVSGDICWTHYTGAGTGVNVQFGIQAVAYSDDKAMDAAFGSPTIVWDTGGTSLDRYKTSIFNPISVPAAVTGAITDNDYILLQVFRSGISVQNNLNIDAMFLGMNLYYTATGYSD